MIASDEEFLKALQKCFGYRLGMFKKVGERYSYPLSLTTSTEQVRSNLVVLGNAATRVRSDELFNYIILIIRT